MFSSILLKKKYSLFANVGDSKQGNTAREFEKREQTVTARCTKCTKCTKQIAQGGYPER